LDRVIVGVQAGSHGTKEVVADSEWTRTHGTAARAIDMVWQGEGIDEEHCHWIKAIGRDHRRQGRAVESLAREQTGNGVWPLSAIRVEEAVPGDVGVFTEVPGAHKRCRHRKKLLR